MNKDRGSDLMKVEFIDTNDSDNWTDKASVMNLRVRQGPVEFFKSCHFLQMVNLLLFSAYAS